MAREAEGGESSPDIPLNLLKSVATYIGVRITPRPFVFIATAAAIYSLGHWLHTFTGVPRLTQPSTLCGKVKRVSAYGLSNNDNGDGGCGR